MASDFSCLINNHDILFSEIIEIIAESGQKRFFVHSDALAKHSEPLRVATTGVWREASEKRIDLSDWDSDTVGRFLQFLYVGSYQVPKSTLYDEAEDKEDLNGGNEEKVEPESQHEEKEPEGLRVNVLMAHAKLYVLAQYKDVEELRTMAFERIRAALQMIDKSVLKEGSNAGLDTVELLEYIYSHTGLGEPIRDLVSTFAARNVERLISQGDMESLLGKGGDLTVELMKKVAGRFNGAEDPYGLHAIINPGKGRTLDVINAEKIKEMENKIRDLEERMRNSRRR